MDKGCIQRAVTLALCTRLAREGRYYVPAAASARHMHLCQAHIEALFGAGHTLHNFKPLTQPGQYACEEKVDIRGPRGELKGVRVLGPARPQTQVEVSVTDAFKLGVAPVVKMSGDIAATPGIRLVGPAGEVEIPEGVIVSARHLHISEEEAALYGLKDGDVISVKKGGPRETVFGNVLVRSGKGHSLLEVHLDTDEANTALLKNGDLLEIL